MHFLELKFLQKGLSWSPANTHTHTPLFFVSLVTQAVYTSVIENTPEQNKIVNIHTHVHILYAVKEKKKKAVKESFKHLDINRYKMNIKGFFFYKHTKHPSEFKSELT